VKGRTPEQKRRMAERITEAISEEGNVPKERVGVAFVDIDAESYCRGGVMLSETLKAPKG
jgi:phenylpyruvate tautomerase PptA (4-oxalocrotonate tautomerase family)